MSAAAVVGRDRESGSIEAFLARLVDGPAALVLVGEAGIGKTALWEAGVEKARRSASVVLAHRSVEAEALLAFAGLSDLLVGVFDEVAPALAPLRRRALEVALLLTDPGDVAPDPRLIGFALLDVLRLLAARAPIVVALEDVQWLDSSSLAVLQIALRRMREDRVGVFATLRTTSDGASSFELASAFPERRVERIGLAPLSPDALGELLRTRLLLELTRSERMLVHETSGGNAFFALELGRELVRTGQRPSTGRGLRVPASLTSLLESRLGRLAPETREILLTTAALGRPTIEVVAAAQREPDRTLEALDAALAEGIVRLDGSVIQFSHPLLATVCYERAPHWRRRAVHRTLAQRAASLEERAHHLALAADGPDSAVAGELDLAADHAALRGATAAAAELSASAAALTPAEEREASRRRRLRAARFHDRAGDGERSAMLLEQLLREVPSGVERAEVLVTLAGPWRSGDPAALVRLGEEALAEAAHDDVLRVRILTDLSRNRGIQGDMRGALAAARTALETAERVGDARLLARAIAQAGNIERLTMQSTPGLLERGVAIEDRLDAPLASYESPRVIRATRLMLGGDLARARETLEETERGTAARGDESSRVYALIQLLFLESLAGRWKRALEHGAIATELTEHARWKVSRAFVHLGTADVLAYLGRVEEARATAAQALQTWQADGWIKTVATGILGHLELALGNVEAAAGLLRRLPEELTSADRFESPTAAVWPDAIEALVAVGERDLASSYLERYEHFAERSSPRTVAYAARCRGLLAAGDGNLAAALAGLERALAEYEGLPYPFERARTLLAVGQVRRQARQKRPAREALEQALAIFEELGAPLWAGKARGELKRISGRPVATDKLTHTERLVASLAAQGRPTKAIAAELFMSTHTVGAHLTRIYRKLGVHSRAELAHQLASTAGVDADRPSKANM